MKVFIRGHAEAIEADQPVPPLSPFSLFVATTPVPLGGEAPAAAQGASAHGMPDLGISRIDAATFPVTLTAPDGALGFAHPAPVASAVTNAPAVGRGDVAGSDSGGGGGGEIGRDSDGLASLALNGPDYADHGWFIVPSAANEYGEAAYAATAGDFVFDVAAGEFSTDWFWA